MIFNGAPDGPELLSPVTCHLSPFSSLVRENGRVREGLIVTKLSWETYVVLLLFFEICFFPPATLFSPTATI